MRCAVALALLLLGSAALAQGLPDLRLDTDLLASSVKYDLQLFDPNDPTTCELQPSDLCVSGPGVRKLLRFSVLAVNQGSSDLVVGTPDTSTLNPDGSPKWVYSTCHKHFTSRPSPATSCDRAEHPRRCCSARSGPSASRTPSGWR